MSFIDSRIYFIRNKRVTKACPDNWKAILFILIYRFIYLVDQKLGQYIWDPSYEDLPVPISEEKGKMLWSLSSMDD